jgi:tripartite-type tricarboxylate transporter receptor subunit TctC
MTTLKKFACVAVATGTCLMLAWGSALAQQGYPNKTIRLVVPYPPGGSTNALARLVAEQLRESMGQQVMVDSRGGGNTVVGSENVAKSSPDGYTLLLTTNAHSVIPHLVTVPFDPIKDFAPIAVIGSTEYVLVAHPSVQASNLLEFIALTKAKSTTHRPVAEQATTWQARCLPA